MCRIREGIPDLQDGEEVKTNHKLRKQQACKEKVGHFPSMDVRFN